MVLTLPNGLVIVCGPSTEANTALATRILGECPRMNKLLIPFPEILMDGASDGANTGDARMLARMDFVRDIGRAYEKGYFVVCNGCYTNKNSLESLIYRLRMVQVKCAVMLIKLIPKGQGGADFEEIALYDFSKKIEWVKRDYLITDPEEIKLKFL